MGQYHTFKTSATAKGVEPPARVELLFLAAYHLIDACAAKRNVHINKHQLVRRELDRNPAILGARTERVRDAFDVLEHRLRVRFVYGGNWDRSDVREAEEQFRVIEDACSEVVS